MKANSSKLELDIKALELDFFSDIRIFAIGASGIPDYRFCWLLNKSLGLDFFYNADFDIPVFEKQLKPIHNSLFVEERFVIQTHFFPIFQHKIPLSESSIYLYNNRCGEKVLIPEYKQVDFFLFVPFGFSISVQEFLFAFELIKEVQWAKELLSTDISSRKNFIF